ncbi:GATOR complex protein depdc5 [Sparganum proliferum]
MSAEDPGPLQDFRDTVSPSPLLYPTKNEAVIFRLSMGSLFHTLTLQPDETITVTKYQARRNQKMDTFSITYRYALQVPDSLTYYPLEVKFANRISSAFNWSYLDNLVCARGIGDSYGLVSASATMALKFWRSRFMILPAYAATTKRLWESLKEGKASGKHVPCDIYEPPLAVHNYDRLCEKFMHFLESVNRIRRTVPAPKMKPFAPKRQMSVDEHFSEKPDLPRTRHDSASAGVGSHPGEGINAAAIAATSTNQTLLSSARLQRLLGPLASASSNFFSPSEPTPTAAAGLTSESVLPDAVFARGTTETPPAPLPPLVSHQHSSSQSSTGSTSFLCNQSSAPTPLSTTSGHGRLMMAILDPESGIPFVTGTPAFPKHTFCSYDLVQWLQRRLVDIVSVSSAVSFAQSLLDAKLMCHASGNPHHRFLFGFFFYTLLVEFVPSGNSADVHEPPHATTKHHPPSAKSSSGSQSSANLPPSTSSGRRSAANSDISPTVTPRGSLVMQTFPFPREFLPQTSHALNAFSLDFQKEWIEVLFIRPVPTLPLSNKSTALSTPSFGDNPKANTQQESFPLTPVCPLPLEEEREVASKSMLDGIFSTALLSEVFGAATNANVHVGTEGILRKRHTSIAQESSTQDHCSEWYCLLYDMNYNPTCGFSLEIQWLVASGCRIADSLLHIYRRASNMGFHFFPVPCYPFGYRGTRIIPDPLRIPIFVSCSLDDFVDDRELRAQDNTASLASPFSPFAVAARLFPNIPGSSAMSAMYEFQSLILSRFGFIPISHNPPVVPSTAPAPREDQCPLEGEETPRPAGILSSQPGCSDSPNLPKGLSFTQRMYVHVSGGMFAMIPTYSHMRPPMRRRVSDCYGSIEVPHLRNGSSVYTCGSDLSSARSYETSVDLEVPMTAVSRSLGTGLMDKPFGIGDPLFSSDSNTRHQQHSLDSRTDCFEAQSQVGFFWTWNHMLPRKWRGQLTGDEAFQDGMLEDFRRFCSGVDNRLATLFADYRTRVLAGPKKHCSS